MIRLTETLYRLTLSLARAVDQAIDARGNRWAKIEEVMR